MSNQYRAVHPSWQSVYGDDVFESELTAEEERDWLDRGLWELVPRPYRVLVDNYTVDGQPVPQGGIVEVGFPIEIETMLVDGGHLERVRRDAKPTVELDTPEPAPEPKARRRRTPQPKE